MIPSSGHRFPGNRKLAGLDEREIENFVDQLQQIPPCLENLSMLAFCVGWSAAGKPVSQELAKAEDRA